jgi:hypothetical protein
MREFAVAGCSALLFSGIALAKITTPITIKGNAFFAGNDRVRASNSLGMS